MNPRLAVDRRPATKTTMEVSDGCQAARWHPTDLTFGRLSPGKDKEANWLPAPDGPICLVMRLYWPNTEALSILPPGEGSCSRRRRAGRLNHVCGGSSSASAYSVFCGKRSSG